jgi:hypothetical protein
MRVTIDMTASKATGEAGLHGELTQVKLNEDTRTLYTHVMQHTVRETRPCGLWHIAASVLSTVCHNERR